MIDIVVLGCGSIWTGEGAAAPFIGVHNLGKIRLAGGVCYPGQIAMGGPNWTVYPGPKINHTTINRRGPLNVWRIGRGWNGGPVCGDKN